MNRFLVVGPVAFTCSLFLSAIFAPISRRISIRLGLIDEPSERRIHKTPIPRGGGIGVFAALHLGMWLTFTLFGETNSTFDLRWWRGLFLGSSIVFLTGLLDDRFKLSASQKLMGQALGALAFSHFTTPLLQVFGYSVPTEISIIVTLVWILTITNAFNLIDGVDGLATGLAAISSLGIAGVLIERGAWSDVVIVTIFFGALLGFFPFNRHPAKMFLGDCGSNFIGFFLACVTLSAGAKGTAVSALAVPLMALAIPLLDTTLAVWRRSVRRVLGHMGDGDRKSRITGGDLDHVHHRLLKTGLSIPNVTAVLCLANALLVLVGLLSFRSWSNQVALIFTGVLLFSFLLVRYLPLREGWESLLMLHYLFSRPKYPLLAGIGYVIWDFLSAAIGYWLSLTVSHPDFEVTVLFDEWRRSFIPWSLGGAALLVGFESLKASAKGQRLLGLPLMLVGILLIASDIHSQSKSAITLSTEGVMFILFFALFFMAGRIGIAGVERTVTLRKKEEAKPPTYAFYSRL